MAARQLCQFRTFSCASAVYKSYSGIALPQRAGPGLHPPPPREVGTTLTPIVAFPCGRTESARILRAVASSTLCSGGGAIAIERLRWCARWSGGVECSVPWVVVLAGTRQKNRRTRGASSLDWTHCPTRRNAMAAQARTATDAFRDVAEESAAQAKENLETMRAAAGEATNLLKHSYTTTRKSP